MNGLQDHFGKSINLDSKVKQDITRYLTQNAAEYTEARIAVEILDSLSSEVPKNIADIPLIIKHHDELQPSVLKRKSVRGLSNCPACHIGVENSGSFKDRFVEIPEF